MFNAKRYDYSGSGVSIPFTRNDSYKIWLVHKTGYLCYANKRIHIVRPALIFINPLVSFAYESDETDRSGYWCVFTEDFLKTGEIISGLQDSTLFKIGSDHVFLLDDEQLKTITYLFDQIINETTTSYIYKYDLIRNYVNILMHEGLKLQPALTRQFHNAAARISHGFLELLGQQYPLEGLGQQLELRKASDFADKLSVHINHLNNAVKSTTGKSTSAHIADRMVYEAVALLKHTDWSISNIAYSLGFEYANHFNNFFKKHMGVTPLSLRK
jgi:AraC-like DNA-binding protein